MLTASEREKIKNSLLRAGIQESEIEKKRLVDKFAELAIQLLAVWARNTPRARNLASPQDSEEKTTRAPPPH